MPKEVPTQTRPQPVHQVMVSSTFTDLKDHRAALILALHRHKLHANVMEHDDALAGVDVIDSSLQMVQESAAYVLLIGFRYGQTPECPTRNPDKLSITELEFDEAQKLGRPILLFIMDEEHPVKKGDFERNRKKEAKLTAFRQRAKKWSADSKVNRVYAVFKSLEDFTEKLGGSLNDLCGKLEAEGEEQASEAAPKEHKRPEPVIPKPPAFYAEPDYIGSHQFVGRESQLQDLSDWARAADPTNLLLFEAIGGNGKSMLTWEWAKNHAMAARPDWAGRFWYSFYERGAVMADFCRRALAYMTGTPPSGWEKMKTPELTELLLAQLHARPWLLILDGLERVLVAYNRIDAAEVPDEEANAPTDKVLDHRNPCETIRDEDGDLLRRLAGAAPSKILVSSRLTPRVLLNSSGQAIPGAKRVTLPGLRPADAELLLKSCGVKGDSTRIQNYLSQNCDNHPLVIGILGGLITNYLPKRGDFDAWIGDPGPLGGARLDLGSLELIQRRNHILRAAIPDLPEKNRQLIATLALLSESVDYGALAAFNPHLPSKPDEVKLEPPPEHFHFWPNLVDWQKVEFRERYDAALERRKDYEGALATWETSAEVRDAPRKLASTVADLEKRGLLQYDRHSRRYGLHPVVRSVAAGAAGLEERLRYGQRVVDYFSAAPRIPHRDARTLEDLTPGLHLVRTLLKLERFQEAAVAYLGDLSSALLFNVEAHGEHLALLKPFFALGWGELPRRIDAWHVSALSNSVGILLNHFGEHEASLAVFGAAVLSALKEKDFGGLRVRLSNMGQPLLWENRLAKFLWLGKLARRLADSLYRKEHLFVVLLDIHLGESMRGNWEEASEIWTRLDRMGRDWAPAMYHPGSAEGNYAWARFWQGLLHEDDLRMAEELAEEGNNRATRRHLHVLRGEWHLSRGEWGPALAGFGDAVRMARACGLTDPTAEAGLALAKLKSGRFGSGSEACEEAQRLGKQRWPCNRLLAMLWREVGELAIAEKHALEAYRWAWADGEPYVRRYELTQATQLLAETRVPRPILPPYDAAKDAPMSWEAEVEELFEGLREGNGAKVHGGK